MTNDEAEWYITTVQILAYLLLFFSALSIAADFSNIANSVNRIANIMEKPNER